MLGVIFMGAISFSNAFALKDKDDRYAIVTVQNVKDDDIKVSIYVYDKEKDKKIEASPSNIETTGATITERFKWDNDKLPDPGITVGTEVITCIEYKSGKGDVSCLTDKFKSESQPFRVTMDVDYIRD